MPFILKLGSLFGLKEKFSLNGTGTVLWKLPPFHFFLHTLTERLRARRIPSSLIPLNRDCRDATLQYINLHLDGCL